MNDLQQPNPQRQSLAPQISDKTSLLAGTSLSVIGVMLWENYTGTELKPVYAVAFGSVFSAIAGYIGHVVKVLVDRAIER